MQFNELYPLIDITSPPDNGISMGTYNYVNILPVE